MAHLIGQSVNDSAGPIIGRCFRRDSTGMQKVDKERASLTEDETEVYRICVGISGYCWTHLIPVTNIGVKKGDALPLTAEAFGGHSWMDQCCLY